MFLGEGERIQSARKRAGLTQKELAQRLGLATGTIQQYELNKRQPRTEQLREIADALGVTLGYLLGYENIQDSELILAVQNQDTQKLEKILGVQNGIPASFFSRRERRRRFMNNETVLNIIDTMEMLSPKWQKFVLDHTLHLIDELLKMQGTSSEEGDPGAVDPKENE